MKIKINEYGYVQSPYFPKCEIELEISDSEYEKIRKFPFNHNWRYINGEFILEELFSDDVLKDRRQKECFNIIDNRSQMWYNHLTSEQKAELDAWYQAWLDVTETKNIPTKPEWLK